MLTRMKLSRGDLVSYDGGAGFKEYGIVVHGWRDDTGIEDYYVAFFGREIPTGRPSDKPAILRFYGSSLDLVLESPRNR
jgi:hypothetical protein